MQLNNNVEVFVISCKECNNPDVAATIGQDMVPVAIASIRNTLEHPNHTLTARQAEPTEAAGLRELIKNDKTRITTFGRLNLD